MTGAPEVVRSVPGWARKTSSWSAECEVGRLSLARGGESYERVMDDASAKTDAGEFRITDETSSAGTVVLAVHGEADLRTAPELRERLSSAIDTGAQAIVLDLTETTFLDSMSLGVLLDAMKRVRAQEGEVRLVVSRADVRRIFEITLLDRVFQIEETREAAFESLGGRVVERGPNVDERVERRDLEEPQDARVNGHQ